MPQHFKMNYRTLTILSAISITFLSQSCTDKNTVKDIKEVQNKTEPYIGKDTITEEILERGQNEEETELPVNLESINDTLSLTIMISSLSRQAKLNDLKGLNDFIHPQLGCYFIYRPGANLGIEHIYQFEKSWGVLDFSVNELYSMLDIKDAKFENWPEYEDCGYSGFSKNGDFVIKSTDYNALSKIHEHNTKEYGEPFLNEQKLSKAKQFEASVKYALISTENSVIVQFIFVDGKWYLGAINKGKFDCAG